jgi:hypothetical protein
MNPEKQYLCSHLVTVRWAGGETMGNLEKIWSRGATLDVEEGVAVGAELFLTLNTDIVRATVTACKEDKAGTLLDVEFESSYTWNQERFCPEHFTDPDIVLVRKLLSELG